MAVNQSDLTLPGSHQRRITGIVAGANAILTTPVNFTAILQGIRISFNTSAVVANRLIRFHNFQNPSVGAGWVAPIVQPASSNWTYYGGIGLPTITGTTPQGIVQMGIPDRFILRPGDVFQTAIINLDAADQIALFEMSFTEWLTD
jgi:hypothetical protein